MNQNRAAKAGIGLGTAILVGVAAFAFAQPAMMEPPEQMTENPLVPAGSASHIAMLSGAGEVPANTTPGTGTAWILLDEQNNTLTWTVEFTGLTGTATGAHFHGPATATETAGVVLSLVAADAVGQLNSPIQGTANITPEQAAQLTGGMWYVNIHTEANAGGEIRGQVVSCADQICMHGMTAPGMMMPPAGAAPAAP